MKAKDFVCNPKKCALSLCHPNSDASLACDEDCYLSMKGVGFKYLKYYYQKYPEIMKPLIKELENEL